MRRWDLFQNGVEEGLQRTALALDGEEPIGLRHVTHAPALAGAGVHDGEVSLTLVGAQVHEKIEGGVDHVVHAGIGTVHLVDHEDHAVALGQGFTKHEAGLGQRAFSGVHEEQTAVHHAENPFHLATEVGVARGINDIYF